MHEKVKEHLGEKTLDEKLKSYRPDCFELIGYARMLRPYRTQVDEDARF